MAIASAEITPAGHHVMVCQKPNHPTFILVLSAFASLAGFSVGFRRNTIGITRDLCNSLAEDVHRTQMGKSYFHRAYPLPFSPAERGSGFRLSIFSCSTPNLFLQASIRNSNSVSNREVERSTSFETSARSSRKPD